MADTWEEDLVGANQVTKTQKQENGWADPSGEYPHTDYHYQPSLNKQATGADVSTMDINGGDPSIDLIDLLGPLPGASTYSDVSVRRTKSGHILTFDDTFGQEHILLKHKDGSGFMLKAAGTMVMTTKKNRVTQIAGTDALLIEGDLKISAQNLEIDATGDLDMRVGGDYNLSVGGEKTEEIKGSSREVIDGSKITKMKGSKSETIVGNDTKIVFGDNNQIIKGSMSFTIGANFDVGATGYSKVTSEQQVAITSPQIDIVGAKGMFELFSGTIGGQNTVMYSKTLYGSSATFSKAITANGVISTSGMTAPAFHGDLNGIATSAVNAGTSNKAVSIGTGGSAVSAGATTATGSMDNFSTQQPDEGAIKSILTGDPRGVKLVSIDKDGEIEKGFKRVKYTVAQVRALLKDAIYQTSDFYKELGELNVISENYFIKIPPAIGRVTNGLKAYLPYNTVGSTNSRNFITGQRGDTTFIPDTTYDPNWIDPEGGVMKINSKTLIGIGIPISTFLAGVGSSTTLNHLDSFEKRQTLARQLMLQTEVVKLCRNNVDRFKNFRLVVVEGVAKNTDESTEGSVLDFRKKGQAITYELYDVNNRNLPSVSYEFAAYIADQLPMYNKITINYDTIQPNPGSLPHEKINTQIIVTMPEMDQDYKIVNGDRAEYKLETVYNDNVQSNSDLVEVLLKGRMDVSSTTKSPHKSGRQYTSADFSPSKYALGIAEKINEIHPSIRDKMASGIQDYLARNFNDLRDMRITEAFRSKARSNKLKAAGTKAAGGGYSWHNYGAAIDIAVYVDGVWDNGSKSIEEYTGRLRRSMERFGISNPISGDSGHFTPSKFGVIVDERLRTKEISLDDYIAEVGI